MTRIFTDGAEMGDLLFWDVAGVSVTVESSTPDPVGGEFYYGNSNTNCFKSFSALSECYFRARVYFSGAPTETNCWFPGFMNTSTLLARVSADASQHLIVAMGSNVSYNILEDSGFTLNTGQWYLIEVHFKMADNPDGIFEVKVDGTQIIDFHGDTKYYAGISTFDALDMRAVNIIYFDDLALNDTAGGVDDSWCGDGIIERVSPNGDGAHNNWHGSDSDDVDNFELVNEYPHDADATYVYHDGADSGTQDQYALSDFDGTDKTILRIYPEARIRKTGAAAHTVKLGTLASGGVDAMSAGMSLTTSYARYVGNEQTENPVDTDPWEEADIDALQFVVEVG